ncbi:hypothetical protein ONS95_014018 [Cadophora gregata]|uniref:uncharacterized protein n=1 Tax=Cadophora gregata TaxID=51156 RepID=UPI0026DDA790|nr:uncharacterized protein ONS95_014018 [Cadophora gregata]KAK0113768.1 hypothetical protein ONS96_014623 [Cadophora gregata f. sp. sojae]KAK0114528.1 hypothetical protein ONS95_014018 [Cadophora gregata]
MPFDFDTYQSKCENLTPEQLHREWENYTRQISGGATSTATAVLFSPLTAGISLVGLGLSAPRIHNARKKRAIIEAKLQAHGQTHNTRKRDVIAPMAISGTIGGLTLGLAGPGADMIAGEAVGKGAEYAAAHVALDATGAVVEHKHDEHSKHKANQRMNLQYQNFQKQFIQEQAAQGVYLQPQPPDYQPGKENAPGQPFQLPQPGIQTYQPLPPSKDQKYEYVPIQPPRSGAVSYQPASHQQAFIPEGGQFGQVIYQQLPPYSPIQDVGPPGTTPNPVSQDPSAQRRQSLYQPGCSQAYPSPCPTPLPVYSQAAGSRGQQTATYQSPSVFPVMDRKSATVQPPTSSSNPECKSSIVDFPMDVFELPAELVTAAVPVDNLVPATPSMEDEILILKARILQMEIEKRGGVIDIVPAHQAQTEQQVDLGSFPQDTGSPRSTSITEEPAPQQVTSDESNPEANASSDRVQSPQSSPVTSIIVEEPAEYQTPQTEDKAATEIVHEFKPLSFYPPPPASSAPPPSSLPKVPLLQTTVQDLTCLSSQLSLETSENPHAQNGVSSNDTASTPLDNNSSPYPAPLKVTPVRQQTSPLPNPAFQQYQQAPRHASLTPSYQRQYSAAEQPPLPSRPQSRNETIPITKEQAYPATPIPQIQAVQPQPQVSYQAQYTSQSNGASATYNPQTYSPPPSSQAQQPQQVPPSRPQSTYQPLSLQSSQSNAPPPQQHQNYPPPPSSPNPQQRPAPPPRPQSIYQSQSAPPVQNNTPISYQQPPPPPPPRPQSVYQPQHIAAAQNTVPPVQQAPTPRPQSIYQPLQFTSAPNTAQMNTQSQPQYQTHQQIYAQPQPTKPTVSPIQRQDSGYYSIPPSRHSSSFSTTSFTPSNYGGSPQVLSPQPTGMLSPQSTGSVYHGRSASVSTMGSPMTPQSMQQQQPYFPPPPGSPAPPVQNDDFGSKVTGYQPGVNQPRPQQIPPPQQPSQGWQWGMPPPQPNYGPPPPIPQPWK